MASITCNVSPFRRPLTRPLAWGAGNTLRELEHVLVQVEHDEISGWGEAVPRLTILNETPASVQQFLSKYSKLSFPLTRNYIDDFSNELFADPHNLTAKSALNCALYSLLARSEGVSLPELLGITPREIDACVILGQPETARELEETISGYHEQEVRGFKVKLTGKEIDKDILEVISQRQDCSFYIDGNELFSFDDLYALLPTLPRNVLYIEEPLPVEKTEDRQRLVRESPIPIVGDDSCKTFDAIKNEISLGTISMLNLKVPRAGITQGLRILEYCQDHEIPVMIGSHAGYTLAAYHSYLLAHHPTVTSKLNELVHWLSVPGNNGPYLNDGKVLFHNEPKIEA